MKISVVVPIYNVPEALLRACLKSLVYQTLRQHEYEILLVDDCSTDQVCLKIIQNFKKEKTNVQLLHHEVNLGLNAARRTGVKAAAGEFIIFLDGDDMFTRDALELLRAEAFISQADVVSAPFYRWFPDEKRYQLIPITSREFHVRKTVRLQNLLAGQHSFTMCGRLFRRDILQDDIFELPTHFLHEDLVNIVRIMLKVTTVSNVKQPVYYYTDNSNSITNKFTVKHVNDLAWAVSHWVELIREAGLLRPLQSHMTLGAEIFAELALKRCLASEKMSEAEKRECCLNILSQFTPLLPKRTSKPFITAAIKGEAKLRSNSGLSVTSFLNGKVDKFRHKLKPMPYNHHKISLIPSNFAKLFHGKTLFVAQVDYQLRNAAKFAKALNQRGHSCVILDCSPFTSGGKRRLSSEEFQIFDEIEYVEVETSPLGGDWLATAKIVIVFNDFGTHVREALEFRQLLDLPTICAVEGICDFERVDFRHSLHSEYKTLPYRRCEHVFLSGSDDLPYFPDRKVAIVGMPVIEGLVAIEPKFPKEPIAVLNVNFTYGALEEKRADFILEAASAFEQTGVNWQITQHPSDPSDLTKWPISNRSQYQQINECTVFVSRFATGILEALASGKPVIYFNPCGEKIKKFADPMGAFQVTYNKTELASALQEVILDVQKGTDFRGQAERFLKKHTHFQRNGISPVENLVTAVNDLADTYKSQQTALSVHFQEKNELDTSENSGAFHMKRPFYVKGANQLLALNPLVFRIVQRLWRFVKW